MTDAPRASPHATCALEGRGFEQLTRLFRCSCWASWPILVPCAGKPPVVTSSASPFCARRMGPGAGALGRCADLRTVVTSLIAMLIGIP